MQKTDTELRSLLLRAARIVLPDKVFEDASLLINEGRITNIYESAKMKRRTPTLF